MKKTQKYNIASFNKEFPDDDAVLEWVKNKLYPNGIFCKVCQKITKHHRVTGRAAYACDWCGAHVYPMVGTIFEKSTTSLRSWFYAIYLMSSTRCGISAKQLQRELSVTYKTAWRMFKEIRSMLNEPITPLSGNVEMDESYFGGRKRGTRGRGSENKTPVFGMVERKGQIKAIAIPNVKSKTVMPIVLDHVQEGARVHTDEFPIYNRLSGMGYAHEKILHAQKIYVDGDVHTQTIDGFWGNIKGGITGVYRHVSPKYLQNYLDEYSLRYNHRDDERPMFENFLRQI